MLAVRLVPPCFSRRDPASSDRVMMATETENREDELLNPLNAITMLVYDTEVFSQVEVEVNKVVAVLEDRKIIRPRKLPRGKKK